MGQEITISAVIITFNEEKNIGRCLRSLDGIADEIIVVDSGSTDKTVEICKRHEARVFDREFDGFSEQKNWAGEQATCHYILSIDADEVLSEPLKKSILKVKHDCTHEAFSFNRRNYYCGKWIRFAGWYPDRKIRIWRKGTASWQGAVHETLTFSKPDIGWLKGDLLHYSFSSLHEHLRTIRRYSGIRADEAGRSGKAMPGLLVSILKAGWKFIQAYLLKAGFLSGGKGFTVCLNSAMRYLIQYSAFQKKRNVAEPGKAICFFNTTKAWGGGEKWHLSSANYIAGHSEKVYFAVSPGSALDRKITGTSLSKYRIKITNSSFINVFKLARLRRFFRDNHIRTVIFNSPADLKAGGLAAFFAGVPNIIYRRGIAVSPRGNWFNTFLFSCVVDQFIVNSHDTLKQLLKNVSIPADSLKINLIYNGLADPLAGESISPEIKDHADRKIILGNASRLVKQKGLDHLLQVAALLNSRSIDFELRIAGTGPLQGELESAAAKLNLREKVKFLGFMDRMDDFYKSLDIYLCTSEFEGFGYSIAEAMMAARPVVAFDTSSNPELIHDAETGYLVPAFDTALFAGKVGLLIDDPSLRNRMGADARKFALMNFEINQQNVRLKNFLLNELK
ncbi:MAG TPA: glycosyltransferase [Bacteroidales bacterium]|nr:glycosyltransferase [Bacteroidales bacterium]HPT02348.1 glycosyltransferase [Bacteroidales bacterium]